MNENATISDATYRMISAQDRAEAAMHRAVRLREAILERAGVGLDDAQKMNLRVAMGAIWTCAYLDGAIDSLKDIDQLAEKDMARVVTMAHNIEHHVARASSAWGILP